MRHILKGIFLPIFFSIIFLPFAAFSQEIILGCSAPMSGTRSFLGKNLVIGMRAYFKYVNDQKGISGKKIRLRVLDDKHDPALTFENTKKFIDNIRPLALIGYVGTSTIIRVLNLIGKEKIPLIGPYSGAHQLRLPYRPYIFNIRNSFWAETEVLVDFAFKRLKKKKIGVVYQDDSYGLTGYKGVCRALAMKYNKVPVVEVTYKKGKRVSNQGINRLLHARPDAVIMIGTYEVLSDFLKRAKIKGLKSLFMTISSVGSVKFAKLLEGYDGGVVISQVVPPPWSGLKVAKEYRKLMKKYYPDKPFTFVGLEGFIDAKVVTEALRRSKQIFSPKSLVKALETFKKYDLGVGSKIDYGPFDREGLDVVFLTKLERNGKFRLIKTVHKKISLYIF